MKSIIIGTRGSALALWQANYVATCLRQLSEGISVELKVIKTKGDKILDVPLAKVGGKGLFVKEIEIALMNSQVDLAVHSIKDLPTELIKGSILCGIPKREDPRDVFVSKKGKLDELPKGAIVGTSSLRRRCQLLSIRPDFEVRDLRGNVDTRLRKLDDGEYDAVIVAAAGLLRLGYKDRVTEYLSVDKWLPAVGQGALGIQTRKSDQEINDLVSKLTDKETDCCVRAERALLASLGGGCQVPIAGHAQIQNNEILLSALVGHPKGHPVFLAKGHGDFSNPEQIGKKVAKDLLDLGAKSILQEVYG